MSATSDRKPASERTSDPFPEAISHLLRARPEKSLRLLAREAGVSPGHLSRVIRGKDGKRPSPELVTMLAAILGVPADYFLEARRARVVTAVTADCRLVDELHSRVARGDGARG